MAVHGSLSLCDNLFDKWFISDPATELRLAKEKIAEYEVLAGAQKGENDRLRIVIRELEEKSESAEIQINSISREYRSLLEEKEKEIKELKHKNHEILQHQMKSSLKGPGGHQMTPTGSIQSLTSTAKDSGFDGSGYQSDDLDFGDNIFLQQEINRLSQEVQRSKSECQHWKSVASQVVSLYARRLDPSASEGPTYDYLLLFQSLERHLETEKDQHQHEVAALQDLHSQKMAALRRKYKQEVTALRDQINTAEVPSKSSEKIHESDTSALDELQSQLEAVETKLIETRQQLKKITAENTNLVKENKSLQEESLKFDLQIESLRNDVERHISLAESAHQKWEVNQPTNQPSCFLFPETEEELLVLKREHSKVRKAVTDSQYTLLDTLDANHAQVLDLLGDLQHLRHQMNTKAVSRRNKLLREKQEIVEHIIDLSQKQKELNTVVGGLESEVADTRQDTADIVEDLGNAEHQQFTADIMDTLQKENLILKNKNLELQEQVAILEKAFHNQSQQWHRKDESPQKLEPHAEQGPDTSSSTSSEQHLQLDGKISLLQAQVDRYETEIEQFEYVRADWQTEKEALEGVLVQLRDSLKEKETALSTLQAQKDELTVKVENAKKSASSWNWDSDESKTEEKVKNTVDLGSLQDELSTLKQKLFSTETELSTVKQEKLELEESIDELDAQHQEALEQVIGIRNNLSRKTEQLGFELSERSEEVVQLKEETDRLKEERIMLMEKVQIYVNEMENKEDRTTLDNEHKMTVDKFSRQIELLEKQLKEKETTEKSTVERLNKAGLSLNELHMDKKELENQLEQSKIQTKEKVEKIKLLREENTQLKKDNASLSERLKVSENEIDSLKNSMNRESENNIVQSELENLKQVNHLMESEKSENLARIEQLLKENENFAAAKIELKGQLAKLNDLEKELERVEALRKTSDNEMESLKLQLDVSEAENCKLKEELDGVRSAFHNQAEQDKTKIERLESKVISLEENLDQSHGSSQSQNDIYESYVQELRAEKLSVEKDLDDTRDKIREHENRLKEFHTKYDVDTENLKLEIKKQVDDNLNKNDKITNLCEQLEELNNYVSEKDSLNEKLADEVSLKEKDIENLNSQQAAIQQQLSRAEEERKSLEESLAHMETKLQELNSKTVESEKTEVLRKENENEKDANFQQMKVQLTLFTEKNETLEKELETIQKSLIQKEDEISEITKTNITKSSLHEQELQVVGEENKQLKEEIDQLENKLRAVEVEKEELEMKTSELEKNLTELSTENIQINEMLAQQLAKIEDNNSVTEKENLDLSTLEKQILHLKEERDIAKIHFREENETLMSGIHKSEQKLADLKEENQELRSELTELKTIMVREGTEGAAMGNLEADLCRANEHIGVLQTELRKCETLIQEHSSTIAELNSTIAGYIKVDQELKNKFQQQQNSITILEQNVIFKDEEISKLRTEIDHEKSKADDDRERVIVDEVTLVKSASSEMDSANMPILVQEGVTPSRSSKNLDSLIEDDIETETIVYKLEELQKCIEEKDSVIAELQRNNSSLLKMLENPSHSVPALGQNNRAAVEINRLENELRNLKLEKEQIMSVMNEKSRECSNLRGEVHQLMNVVSAEKAAISKLQKDNLEIVQGKKEDNVDEMQREALQNLSRLVRDKDLEVEALTQKNNTLLILLQENSPENTQVSELLRDKDNLTKQLAILNSEREQMVAYLNQKHQESLSYHNEIQKLSAYISTETEKFESLQQEYQKIVPQFEDKNHALVKAQNELINYKQKYSELEVKYGELLQRSDAEEVVDAASHNNTLIELNAAKEKLDEFKKMLSEKDEKIQNVQKQLKEVCEKLSDKDAERNSLKKQVDSLEFQAQGLKIELEDLGKDQKSSRTQLSEHLRETQRLQELNNQLMLKLQETEFEMKTSQEKVATLTNVLNQQQGEESRVDSLMLENEAVRDQARQFQHERDQAVMALKQTNQDIETDRRETAKMKEKEGKLQSELGRLRSHLLQIEEGYTREALEAEEREKELRNKLIMAEEKLLHSATAVENASQQTSHQLDSLQQQLHSLATQRDQAYLQIAKLQEQCQQYSVSLANLQMVLEQFQKERENQIVMETEKYMQENLALRQQLSNLQSEYDTTKERLEEAADGLAAAARLSEQLDRREESLSALREEVQFRENLLKQAEEEVNSLKTQSEGKVDKFVMKNLFLGYFSTPQNKRDEVIHMVGGVLEFSKEDFEKVQESNKGWMPGFFKFGAARGSAPLTPTTTRRVNKSFSELFVKFLEKESSPPPPTVRLPAEEMARDVEKQREAHRPTYNPFTAPRHVAVPSQTGRSTPNSHILMGDMAESSPLPMFLSTDSFTTSTTHSKHGYTQPTSSSAILKDVLEPH
ncbi:hypothetical protein ScPMuIL_014796 [Solemya velum]